MKFICDIRLPENTTRLEVAPTVVVREAFKQEGGNVIALYGCNGGWDCCCICEFPTPEAQVRACLTLRTAGFTTSTRTCIEPNDFDKAWEAAVAHPVAVGR